MEEAQRLPREGYGRARGRVDEAAAPELDDQLSRWQREYVLRAAHELRNPVAAIAAIASTLTKRDQLDEQELDEAISLLSRVSEHLRELVLRLLDSGGAVGVQPQIEVLDVGEVVGQVADAVPRPEHAVLLLDTAPGLHAAADPLFLRQVLINLLSNAYRYGGDHVMVTTPRNRSGSVQVKVMDDGPGLPDDVARKLSQPFVHGDPAPGAPRDLDRSLGLGLSIAYELVEPFASLAYERTDGWTTFTLDFHLPTT